MAFIVGIRTEGMVNVMARTTKEKTKKEIAKEELRVMKREDKKELVKRHEMSAGALEVLEHWNSKGIVKHKPDNQELIRNLPQFVTRYDIEDIKTSIDNYAMVYFDKEYKPFPGYEPYKWTLAGFLAFDKQVCKFMPDGQSWLNYCNFKEKQVYPLKRVEDIIPWLPADDIYQQCLQQLKTMDYKEYIQTEHWQHFRSEALKHFNTTCQLCGATNERLDVHHKTYINRGRETFNDVILLCRHCHDLYHHNKDRCNCERCAGGDGQHELTM